MQKNTRRALIALLIIIVIIMALGFFRGPIRQRIQQRIADRLAQKQEQENPTTVPTPGSKLGAGNYSISIEHQGVERKYILHVPASYQDGSPTPLVLSFHGGGGNAQGQAKISGMNDTSDKNGFIVAYPEGTAKFQAVDLAHFWNPGSNSQGNFFDDDRFNAVDDIGFVEKVLNDIESRVSIDTNRVYATGFSNGSIFSQSLACNMSSRIAAIAAVNGPMWADAASCTLSRPVSVLMFFGTADPCVQFNGGVPGCKNGLAVADRTWISAAQNLTNWLSLDGINESTKRTVYQKGDATCDAYGPASNNAAVLMCTIEGGGHTWPGGQPYNVPGLDPGKISTDINASDFMWTFFKDHPKQ